MSQLLVIGSVALDTIVTPFGKSKEVLGGSATYFSIGASFWTDVNLVAVVGKDFPERYRSIIDSFGIDISGLETKDGKTFRWEGSYIDGLNCAKTIKTQLNVFSDFKPAIPNGYKKSPFLFLANIDPDIQQYLLKKLKDAHLIGCDSMNYWIQNKPQSLKRLIKNVTLLFLNEHEAKLLSGETNIIKAGKTLLSLGTRFVIIKRGEYGALLFDKNGLLFIVPAYPLDKVCDPTGAGDTFAGGFMGYLSRVNNINNNYMRKALIYGSVIASFSVEDFSIHRFLKLKKKDIEERYNKLRILTTIYTK